MKTSKALIISSVIILVGIVFYSLSHRYYIDTSTKLIVDRFTGEIRPAMSEPEVDITTYTSPMITLYAKETESVFLRASRIEHIKNINLLAETTELYQQFKTYYNDCIKLVKKDPLYYVGKSESNMFAKYSSLLLPPDISQAYTEKKIEDADSFIAYLLDVLEKSIIYTNDEVKELVDKYKKEEYITPVQRLIVEEYMRRNP